MLQLLCIWTLLRKWCFPCGKRSAKNEHHSIRNLWKRSEMHEKHSAQKKETPQREREKISLRSMWKNKNYWNFFFVVLTLHIPNTMHVQILNQTNVSNKSKKPKNGLSLTLKMPSRRYLHVRIRYISFSLSHFFFCFDFREKWIYSFLLPFTKRVLLIPSFWVSTGM